MRCWNNETHLLPDSFFTENSLLKSKSATGETLLEYAYDRSRNLSCLTDRASNTLHYTYDAMDRLKQVSEGQGDILASHHYNPSGGLCKLQYGTAYRLNTDTMTAEHSPALSQ